MFLKFLFRTGVRFSPPPLNFYAVEISLRRVNPLFEMMVKVYILQSKSKQLRYIGITNNISRRLAQHGYGQSSVLKMLGEFECVYTEDHDGYKSARKREKYFKSGVGTEWMNTPIKKHNP